MGAGTQPWSTGKVGLAGVSYLALSQWATAEVPALVCGSFSDHNLHSRGSFEGFRRIGSTQKWLYTHRGPKWSTFYAADAVAFQQRFFDHFLKGEANGMADVPPVRPEVRSDARTVTALRGGQEWPPSGTSWTPTEVLAAGERGLSQQRFCDGFGACFRSSIRWLFVVAGSGGQPQHQRGHGQQEEHGRGGE